MQAGDLLRLRVGRHVPAAAEEAAAVGAQGPRCRVVAAEGVVAVTFAALAAVVGLAVAVAVVVTAVAIVTWSDRRRAGLPAMLPSAVLAIVLGLAVAAWAWVAPIWLPLGVYAIGVGWGLGILAGELRSVRRTSADVAIVGVGLVMAAFWPLVAIGREVMRRRGEP